MARMKSQNAFAAVLLFLLAIALTLSAQAQTVAVLYSFTGGLDGASPSNGLTPDGHGNFYGTTATTVFKLTRHGSGWIFATLYTFQGGADGYYPSSPVIVGPNGSLFGTTEYGGTANYGTVFNLSPPPTVCPTVFCPWTHAVLYSFTGQEDGMYPLGRLAFDQAGNLYGSTYGYGTSYESLTSPKGRHRIRTQTGGPSVWELVNSNGVWTFNLIWDFPDGDEPDVRGITLGPSGALYGVSEQGGEYGAGTVFQLTRSGSQWSEQLLYVFNPQSENNLPFTYLAIDQSGNLYGTTYFFGTIFQLTQSNGNWEFQTIYEWTTGVGPTNPPAVDAQGNLYGYIGSYLYELMPSDGSWNYTNLYTFSNNGSGGPSGPTGVATLDASGDVYGVSIGGGANNLGTIWEFTP